MRSIIRRSELLIVLLGLALASCATPPDPKSVLQEQILIPYPGRQGLIYPRCDEYKLGDCVKWDRKTEYLLSDPPTRTRLRSVEIACRVGQDYYSPCPDANALCMYGDGKRPYLGGLLGKKPTVEKDRIHLDTEYQRLLDGRTYCMSAERMQGGPHP